MVNRVLKYGLIAAVCALPALFDATPANAISWGKKLSNGKTCRVLFGTHHHTGRGGVKATKSAATTAALDRWSRFSAWEYGKAWGNYALAQDKSITCRKVPRGGYRCKVVAQPCKS